MANAIKKISVARGYDVTRYTCGALAVPVASTPAWWPTRWGCSRCWCIPLAGVLSAYGMGLADQNVIREQAVESPLTEAALPAVQAALDALAEAARADLARQQASGGAVALLRRVHVRYEGSDAAGGQTARRPVRRGCAWRADLVGGFEAAYRQRYAFRCTARAWWSRRCRSKPVVAGMPLTNRAMRRSRNAMPRRARCVCTPMASTGLAAWHDAALVVRENMPRRCAARPAIIAEKNATTIVEPGWRPG